MEESLNTGVVRPYEAGDTYVKVVRDYEQLEELRPVWTAWQEHPNADMDFCLKALHSLPSVIRPHVLVLYKAGTPQAMLVGRLEQGLIGAKLGYFSVINAHVRMMTFIRGGHLGSASPQDTELMIREVLSSLKRGEAEAASFSHVDVESPIYRYATSLAGLLTRDHVPSINVCRKKVLPKSADQVYDGLCAKTRKNLKREQRKLIETFEAAVSIRCFRDTEELEEMFRDVEEIAKKTYQRGLGVGFRDSAEMRARMRLAADRKWLRAYVLYLKGIPVAFWIGVLYHRTFHSDFMGYDPAYGKHSPGMFLIMKAIEGFCGGQENTAVEAIDFGLGDAQYKAVLGTAEWRDGSLFVFAPTFRGIELNLMRTPVVFLNRAVATVVHRIGIAQRIKRSWRNSVIHR